MNIIDFVNQMKFYEDKFRFSIVSCNSFRNISLKKTNCRLISFDKKSYFQYLDNMQVHILHTHQHLQRLIVTVYCAIKVRLDLGNIMI